jgi:hypothetical protein
VFVVAAVIELRVHPAGGGDFRLMQHYGVLTGEYAKARQELATLAGSDAERIVRRLQATSERDLEGMLANTSDQLETFEAKKRDWSAQVRRIAAAGIDARSAADRCYRAMLERYLEFRATGGELDGRARERRRVTVSGYFDLGSAAMDRGMNLQLNGFRFGEYDHMSSALDGFAGNKRLDELASWDVHIRLDGTQGDGWTEIVRTAGEGPQFVRNIGQVGFQASIMGVETHANDVARALRELDSRWSTNIGLRCMRLPTKP